MELSWILHFIGGIAIGAVVAWVSISVIERKKIDIKTCLKCGKSYKKIPKEATLAIEARPPGYYFNCTCRSTLVWPYVGNLEKKVGV